MSVKKNIKYVTDPDKFKEYFSRDIDFPIQPLADILEEVLSYLLQQGITSVAPLDIRNLIVYSKFDRSGQKLSMSEKKVRELFHTIIRDGEWFNLVSVTCQDHDRFHITKYDSDLITKSLSRLLDSSDLNMSVNEANKILLKVGILAHKKHLDKQYLYLTERGAIYGVNRITLESDVITHPYYYVNKFDNLAEILKSEDDEPRIILLS